MVGQWIFIVGLPTGYYRLGRNSIHIEVHMSKSDKGTGGYGKGSSFLIDFLGQDIRGSKEEEEKGWPDETKVYEYKGKKLTIRQWAQEYDFGGGDGEEATVRYLRRMLVRMGIDHVMEINKGQVKFRDPEKRRKKKKIPYNPNY